MVLRSCCDGLNLDAGCLGSSPSRGLGRLAGLHLRLPLPADSRTGWRLVISDADARPLKFQPRGLPEFLIVAVDLHRSPASSLCQLHHGADVRLTQAALPGEIDLGTGIADARTAAEKHLRASARVDTDGLDVRPDALQHAAIDLRQALPIFVEPPAAAPDDSDADYGDLYLDLMVVSRLSA